MKAIDDDIVNSVLDASAPRSTIIMLCGINPEMRDEWRYKYSRFHESAERWIWVKEDAACVDYASKNKVDIGAAYRADETRTSIQQIILGEMEKTRALPKPGYHLRKQTASAPHILFDARNLDVAARAPFLQWAKEHDYRTVAVVLADSAEHASSNIAGLNRSLARREKMEYPIKEPSELQQEASILAANLPTKEEGFDLVRLIGSHISRAGSGRGDNHVSRS